MTAPEQRQAVHAVQPHHAIPQDVGGSGHGGGVLSRQLGGSGNSLEDRGRQLEAQELRHRQCLVDTSNACSGRILPPLAVGGGSCRVSAGSSQAITEEEYEGIRLSSE